VGQYVLSKDVILLDKKSIKQFPTMRKIILLHEMFHSTLCPARTNRIERLIKKLGQFKDGSNSFKMEECIAEICTMVACMKLGLLNKYTSIVIEDGIKNNYSNDMTIPWMEVVSALNYFCDDNIDFNKELKETKDYLISKYQMKIARSYESNTINN
jgi:antirestriction protein ArdC